MTAAITSWRAAGVPHSTIALHVRTLRAVLGWAYAQRMIDCQPLDGMRGLAQLEPRRDVPVPVVVTLLAAAARDVEQARQQPTSTAASQAVHQAEQVRLLLRLAADTGARRGELGALRLEDLDGRRLHIERGVSAEVVTTTKTGRARTVTVGGETARLWQDSVELWRDRTPKGASFGPWLFS